MSTSGRAVQAGVIESDTEAQVVKLPLCVDLDGTLIKTDVLLESLIALLKQTPWVAILVPWWLLRGRAFLKRELAARVEVPAQKLPYREDVLEFIRRERQSGR